MSIAPIVELYRLCGRPPSAGSFSSEVDFSAGVELVSRIRKNLADLLRDVVVDGEFIDEHDPLPANGHLIKFRCMLPGHSSSTFHGSLSDLLRSDPKIPRGEMPRDFYLLDEDFYSEDEGESKRIHALVAVCNLIKKLADLAHYHDARSRDNCLKLVFMQPGDTPSSSAVVLETRVDIELVHEAIGLDTTLVDELVRTEARNDPHYTARIGVFGASLREFLASRPDNVDGFTHLVSKWNDFVEAYQRNLETYISGFAFHKAKREVADAEFEVAAQFSKVVGDIAGKLLGIPVSLAAVVILIRAETLAERTILLIGLFLASILIAGVVGNQQRQLERIKHAKGVVLNAIEGKRDSYPEDLRADVQQMKKGLANSETKLDRWLLVFRVLSWVPAVCGLVAFVSLYRGQIFSYISSLGH